MKNMHIVKCIQSLLAFNFTSMNTSSSFDGEPIPNHCRKVHRPVIVLIYS